MRSLTVKITLIVLALSLAATALVALLVRWSTVEAFDRLLVDQRKSAFVELAATYYADNNTWNGFSRVVAESAGFVIPREDRFEGRNKNGAPDDPRPQQPPSSFGVANMDGRIIVPAGDLRPGDPVAGHLLDRGIPVEVDGEQVGTVIDLGQRPSLNPLELQYIMRTNQAIFYAAIGAALIAVLLGIGLARMVTRPLRELTDAAHAMADGQLKQEVPVRSQDELGELAAAFNRMSDEVDQANEKRRQMTADIAHDLRNPVMVLIGYIEAMRDGVLKPTPERLDMMYDESQRLSRLVADLRTLSLADAGQLTLMPVEVDIIALLNRTAAVFQQRAADKEVDLHVKTEGIVPIIQADAERLAQVLDNLVGNALRYTPSGGEILLSASSQPEGVQVRVSDTGPGISPETLPRVFDRFYRGDSARSDTEGASGLGLAIVRSIVNAHGGQIAVDSAPGKGATFIIDLPFRPSTTVYSAARSSM